LLLSVLLFLTRTSSFKGALLGREVKESTVRFYMSNEDWKSDAKGFNTLNKKRLEDCFFTMADRFTSGTESSEYVAFLNRVLTRIVTFDPETGEVGLRDEEDIWKLGDIDPLVENKEFKFKSKKQLEAEAKAARKATKAPIMVDRFDSSARAQPPSETDWSSSLNARLQSETSLSYSVVSRIMRAEGFNEATLPIYAVVFDWEGEDEKKLTVQKGEIVFACPLSLRHALGSPPDEEGWTLAIKVNEDGDSFGWCPDTVMVYLSRPKKPQPIYTIVREQQSTHDEDIVKVAHSEIEKITENNEALDDDNAVHEELVKRGLDVKGSNVVRKERLQRIRKTEFRVGDQVKHNGLRAIVRAVHVTKNTKAPALKNHKDAAPVFETLCAPTPFGSPGQERAFEAAPFDLPEERNVGLNTERVLAINRPKRVGGGNLRFPGFSLEPAPKLSERTSGPHLSSEERARFSQSWQTQQTARFVKMAGVPIPPAQPTQDMVAAAARRYAAKSDKLPVFLHHGFFNTAIRSSTSQSIFVTQCCQHS